MMIARLIGLFAVIALGLSPATASAQATIEIVNIDFDDEGFNDTTPAEPIGGNPGTTVGQQRLNAFEHAAGIWGGTLTSVITIRILAFFDHELGCTATGAVLGGAAPYRSFRFTAASGFPGRPDTWYPVALAEKLTSVNISEQLFPDPFQAFAIFNPDLGQPGCLENSGWYYGLDTNTPAGQIDMVTVLLHEFAHGLGFTVGPTNANTGVRAQGFPSIWESQMLDVPSGKKWLDMNNDERAISARNVMSLVWQGTGTSEAVPDTLDPGTELVVQGNPRIRGNYNAEPATFGTPIEGSGLRGVLTRAHDLGGASEFDGCDPIISDVAGRIALVDRGTCTFVQKAQNAQAAGAVGLVVANNSPPGLFPLGGTDPSLFIPVVGITQADGAALRSVPQLSGNGDGGVPVRLRLTTRFRAGTTAGFPRLYAPTPFQQGSSVSHFDTSMTPNMLMEPFINSDLTHAVTPPTDLTFLVLRDIGW